MILNTWSFTCKPIAKNTLEHMGF